jgi:hypothetical protein
MIKKRRSSKIRYYHQSSYRRSSRFRLFHRFKRTMSVLGRSEIPVELRSACCLYSFILENSTELDVEQVQEYLFLLKNALKHLLKPTLSTVFMDLDSYLNPKGCLMSTYIYLR